MPKQRSKRMETGFTLKSTNSTLSPHALTLMKGEVHLNTDTTTSEPLFANISHHWLMRSILLCPLVGPGFLCAYFFNGGLVGVIVFLVRIGVVESFV